MLKVKKSQLRKMIRESIAKQTVGVAKKQKHLAAYAKVCVSKTPFIKEYSSLKSKASLLEFVGPFKKLRFDDPEDKKRARGQKEDVKVISQMAKEVEAARKKLAGTKLTNVDAVEKALDDYINKLYDLYEIQDVAELDPKTKMAVSKPFAAAAYTLQGLSRALGSAANKLFTAVPKGSGVYSAGAEAEEIEQATKSFMMGPGQRLAKAGKDIWGGLGGPGGGRFG